MRKNFGAKPYVYPMPVFIIGSYDENGVANAMNCAWGCICDYKKIALFLDARHKTVKNILLTRAFTVSMATKEYVTECDYVGIVSGNQELHKLDMTGFHISHSEFVNAPLINELPLTLECQMVSYDKESEMMIGEIINVSADESVLVDGKIDPMKLSPLTFDPVHNAYLTLGEKVGNAFSDGKKLKG